MTTIFQMKSRDIDPDPEVFIRQDNGRTEIIVKGSGFKEPITVIPGHPVSVRFESRGSTNTLYIDRQREPESRDERMAQVLSRILGHRP